jgi:Ca2+-transporting ATPase
MPAIQWHTLTATQVQRELHVDSTRGLTQTEAKRRLARYGPNKLAEKPRKPAWRLLIAQFQDFMVMVLLAATAISALLGEKADAIAILAIVVINAILGYVQEAKAEASLAALKKLAAPRVRVLRQQEPITIPAEELVPGDVVDLESGDRIGADIYLLHSTALAVDESLLTGESHAVAKNHQWIGTGDEALGDRKNMVFMGTAVVRGRARGIVVATGMRTQIGEIAGLIQEADAGETPLQTRLSQLGRWLVLACLGVVSLVFAAGVLQGMPVYQMFLTGVSLAVAAIPEGLPAVVTIALAIGVQRMIKRQAIVRRLPAVETLGCATVICSDKTGTLTKNEMTVVRLVALRKEVSISGVGYDPQGAFLQQNKPIDPLADPDWRTALFIACLCNHASVSKASGKSAKYKVVGDPTEAALVVMGIKGGIAVEALRKQYPAEFELPFDSDRKRMSVIVPWQGLRNAVKGAPDIILERCTHVMKDGRVVPLGPQERRLLRRKAADLGSQALRVLALAYRPLVVNQIKPPVVEETLEQGLVFVALAAMIDPPRPEVKYAVRTAERAGIRTIMVTGDHRNTAAAIGEQLGLNSAEVVTGDELDKIDDAELRRVVGECSIFARVSPRHKLRIVRALHDRGEVVAMTGDGINDAPAVKEADIGIAMGLTGADVTKEAGAMVLADDNYATIVVAIEEGRGIYDNIRKFIRYLLACNVGEVLTMFLATVSGMPLPLIPTQILWMNLVTDGLPAIALGVDPPDNDVMRRPPRRPDEGVFSRGLYRKIIVRGMLIGIFTVSVFMLARALRPHDLPWAQTMAFTSLVMAQLFYVFQCRSEYRSVFDVGVFSNKFLNLAVFISLSMQLGVIYLPLGRQIFHTVPLTLQDWGISILFSGWSIIAEGVLRVVRMHWRRHVALVRVNAR